MTICRTIGRLRPSSHPRAVLAFLMSIAVGGLVAFLTSQVAAAEANEKTAGTSDPPEATSETFGNDAEIIAAVNQLIRAGWEDAGVVPSPEATDSEWCRRVYLDCLGRIPTIAEVEAFESTRSRDKRSELVDRLLSEEYVADYSRNWSTIWTNLLIGRTGGQNRRSLVNRPGMEAYLKDAFSTNKPYDQIVYELISATGSNNPEQADFNGAVNFLLDKLQDNAVNATAQSARLFLGVQVQCTQCHNHPFNNWKQDQFWSFNSFFRQTQALREYEERDIVNVRLDDGDFAGEGGDPREAEVYFELRNGRMKVAYPTFLDGTEIKKSGYVDEVNRREELARLMTASDDMSRAIVNRMWAHFFSYGFTKPVDDMGPHNPPSHPDLLNLLATQFTASGHDLKQLIRWITLSEAYSLSSRITKRNETDAPEAGGQPLFSRFYMRQMRAEELYESLLVATEAEASAGQDEMAREKLKRDWLEQFTIAFGTDENDETSTFNGTIPQMLMMMNGDLMKRATGTDKGGFLYTVAHSDKKDRDKIRYLYNAALARAPTKPELVVAQKLWVARDGDSTAALQDVWWALLNSNEFILNH